MKDILNPQNPILIVDDEKSVVMAIDTTLQMAGFNNIVTCNDSREVMGLLEKDFELVLMDLNMPYIDGESLLTMVIREFPDIRVIIVTGTLDIETAVNCMRKGAFDYIVKPVEEAQLITAVNRSINFNELNKENQALKQHILTDSIQNLEAFSSIITQNKQMQSIFQYIESIAPTSQPVLVTGETGVGKELICRSIHKLSGVKGRLITVNVAGLDDNMFSDTLFGHVKGAFTGASNVRPGLIEKAKGGTLFLDEIGDLSPASQVKLLRLLQEGEYLPLGQDEYKKTDSRIVVATNKVLWDLQKEGLFRKDLIYRLQTHHVHIPPLRDRIDDIPLLVDCFLEKAAKSLKKTKPKLTRELINLLELYLFPGNIRELESMIFDALSMHKSRILSLDIFKRHIESRKEDSKDIPEDKPKKLSDSISLFKFSNKLPTIKQATEILVTEALRWANGNKSIAADILGISRQALSKRVKNLANKKS